MKDRPTYTIIGDNTKIEGTLHIKGSLMVAGEIDGDIFSSETVRIAEEAKVSGKVTAAEVFLNGFVGNGIHCAGKVVLGSQSKLIGELTASRLIVEEGAVFVGKSEVNDPESTESAE
ncbi:MAG TPA: polymer-forming cytoskeletal protein [Candidatus Marinimicrobia bacterium]|mgnify:CR=1 FL=1|nr:polymer-forming cytoskeletal protein [Candidatus Neomarinimicrobiota bacterium]